ncbi:MAG TPA: hypothetical protein DCZ94_05275 [Lentisphaeria bacterium]|nr:hypothetical protein [Lentisphaeria bacterium]
MILPHRKNIYLIPLSEIRFNGEAIPMVLPCHMDSGNFINSLGANIIIPEGLTDGIADAFHAKSPTSFKFTEILATEEIGRIKMRLPQPGATFIISRKKSHEYFHIESEFISREHAQVIVYDKCIRVEDLKSKNGTYVNGERIKKKVVYPGDFFSVGDRTFILGYSVEDDLAAKTQDVQEPFTGL